MTANQIAYWNMMENRRANEAKETETHRSNVEHEAIERGKLGETRRANLANEGFKQISLGIDQYNADTQRSRAYEDARHNIATEREANRSNVAKETETNRSNVARENETYRSNVARETETNRSNVAGENLKRQDMIRQIDTARMEESGRNARNALDNLVKVVGTAGQTMTGLITKGIKVIPAVGSGLTITNAN